MVIFKIEVPGFQFFFKVVLTESSPQFSFQVYFFQRNRPLTTDFSRAFHAAKTDKHWSTTEQATGMFSFP